MHLFIHRYGFDDFQTEIYHLSKMFFEDAEVHFEEKLPAKQVPDSYLTIDLHITETAVIDSTEPSFTRMESQALVADKDEQWTAEHHRTAPLEEGTERRRARKRAVVFVLLQAMERATGMEQPWGILTGVRPTKLLHNMRQRMSREDSIQTLRKEYLIREPKVQLLTEIADRQLQVIPDLFHLDNEVSLYIGIPFCPTKCAYCTFPAYDIRGNTGSVGGFLQGLHEEIREIGKWLRASGKKVTTLYWGGGTPTSIEADEMDALFQTLHMSVPNMAEIRELTVEAGRPDTITVDKLQVLKKWKVDRISINPQSFTQQTLDTIGRFHSVQETIEKFKLSRELGIENINMDIIIGLPNEGKTELEHTLQQLEELMPESLTVHTLSFKRASRMTKNRSKYRVAERDEITRMMNLAAGWTHEHGYYPYYLYRQKNILGNLENTGYSLNGKESLYNILMMEERQTVIGLGCGAVSKICFPNQAGSNGSTKQKVERFPNPKEPKAYIDSYREYIDKKITLLDQAYGRESSVQAQ